jgi:predicted lipoprotein with Yx(FWY)xxD motif
MRLGGVQLAEVNHQEELMNRGKVLGALIAAVAGFGVAGVLGVAVAKTFTLGVGKNVKVGSKSENVATSGGFTVYDLTGDSKAHPECKASNMCFTFWPPVKVSSAKQLSKAPGINGKLGVWKRNGFNQVTLNGHPLYRFSGDSRKGTASGEGIKSFGGTWHVIKASGSSGGSGGTTNTGTGTTGTTTTTTTGGCPYPPCTPGYP